MTKMFYVELKQREMDRERQKMEWELKERQATEQRIMGDELLRQNAEKMTLRMQHQEEDLRRRQQENMSFMQVCFTSINYSLCSVFSFAELFIREIGVRECQNNSILQRILTT